MLARQLSVTEDAVAKYVVDNFEVTTSHLNAAIKHYRDAASDFGAGDSDGAEFNIVIAQRHIRLAHFAQECATASMTAKAKQGR
jgi:hypothetical protein